MITTTNVPYLPLDAKQQHDRTEILLKVALSIITLIHAAANNMFHVYIGREQVQECITKNSSDRH
jgi:hypothetical protein